MIEFDEAVSDPVVYVSLDSYNIKYINVTFFCGTGFELRA
jgi:hypothetical protein